MADATSYHEAIDGSPSDIRSYGHYYAGIADAIADTIVSLQTVTNAVVTKSEAVTAFVDVANEVRTNLSEVERRYDIVAEQLALYAAALEDLKQRAAGIQRMAREANDELPRAQWRLASERNELIFMLPDDPKRPQLQATVNRLDNEVDDLQRTIWNANRDLQLLLDEWRGVADRCADAIQGVIKGSSLNNDFGDWLVNLVEEVLPALEFWLDVIAIVLTVVAIILVFTGVGAAIAPALMLIARLAQVASKALKIIRVTLTVALVVAGKLPPTKLIEVAVDFALDKAGGKLVDKASGWVGSTLLDRFGKGIQQTFAKQGWETAADNLKDIRKKGFDDWMEHTFADAIDLDDWTVMGVELDDVRIGDFHFELDDLGEGVAKVDDYVGKVLDLGLPGGAKTAGGDLLWGGSQLLMEVSPLDIPGWAADRAGDLVPALTGEPHRPSYDELVRAL